LDQEIKKNKKDEQHIVPRTYLKHWKISDAQNFVYGIDLSNKYNKGVQIFGLNHKVFKERKYYNDNSLQNPYTIEDVLGEEIEPNYDKIMNEVNSEIILSQPIREKIMQWLYISKMRSPYTRNSAEQMANFLYKTTELYKEKNLSPEKEKAIEEYSQRLASYLRLG
jgi:hypothetical protein